MADKMYRKNPDGDPNPGTRETRVDTLTETGHDVDERRAHVDRPVVDESVTSERTVGARYYDSLPTRVNAIIFAVLLGLEGLLTLRFLLVAFGASRNSGFVDFIMNLSWPFVRPFSNAFTNRTWDQGIIEMSTLLAIGVWFLGFMLLALLINAILPKYDESGTRIRRERVTHV